jgi:AraC-like DNA-binding protein
MSADFLSDVLRAVRLSGAVYFSVDASAPWVAEAPHAPELGPHIMPGVEHVIEYHVITRGSCGEIAGKVGYGSDAALSRAYKRWLGVAPADWRRGKRGEMASST